MRTEKIETVNKRERKEIGSTTLEKKILKEMRGKGCRLVIQSSQHPFQVAHAFAQVFLSPDMQEKPYCTNGDHHTDRHVHRKHQKGIFTFN